MSQDILDPAGVTNPAANRPDHDPAATPAPSSDRIAAALEHTDVRALAHDVAQAMDPAGSRIEVAGPRAVVPTHPGMLRPTLRLLVEDALRAAGSEGRVQILVRVHGFDVDLVITDPGTVPPERSGAGAGLAQAGPLARRLGARLQLSLDPEGHSEVRLRLPRIDPDRTLLVVGHAGEQAAQAAARLGLSTLHAHNIEEALECVLDHRAVRAALVLSSAWDDARPADVLALRCALLPAPIMSAGPAPDVVASLVQTCMPEAMSHTDLREALAGQP